MPVDPITSINRIAGLTSPGEIGKARQPASALNSFGQLLSSALDDLQHTERTANDAMVGLASGEDIELHQVMLDMQEADITFQLALQVRNKLVEAYQEVMRMQV
jgi:flagellar hook-basal body complex protein FliE